MTLTNAEAEIFVPDGLGTRAALERTTVMGVSAHQDDLEILAYHGILRGFGNPREWFTGVVVTNGSGSPRAGLYADYTDQEMRRLRCREQKKAAVVGEYAAVALLDYPSSAVKPPYRREPVHDLENILAAAQPEVIYTHNLADKHDTHVAVALRLIQALRSMPLEHRPRALYGCEVWRDLDWLCDQDKEALEVDSHENLAASLIGVYDSQISGGKRYDLATLSRRRAHATYHASHATDTSEGLTFAMDLTPLIVDPDLDPRVYVGEFTQRFAEDVSNRISSMQ